MIGTLINLPESNHNVYASVGLEDPLCATPRQFPGNLFLNLLESTYRAFQNHYEFNSKTLYVM